MPRSPTSLECKAPHLLQRSGGRRARPDTYPIARDHEAHDLAANQVQPLPACMFRMTESGLCCTNRGELRDQLETLPSVFGHDRRHRPGDMRRLRLRSLWSERASPGRHRP
jgi:hypothetical protein